MKGLEVVPILTSILTFFLFLPALPAEAVQIGGGAKLGFSIINQSGDAAYEDQRDFGTGLVILNLGGFAHIRTCRFSSLQPELLYTRKGQGGFGPKGTQVRAHYLEIPLLVKISTPPEWKPENVGFNLFLGPEVGFLIWGAFVKEDTYWLRFNRKDIFRESITNEYRRVDFGGVAGIGIDLDRGWGVMTIEARYTFSLINAGEIDSQGDPSEIKNEAFSLMLGIMWLSEEDNP